jgi:hypothetical protein
VEKLKIVLGEQHQSSMAHSAQRAASYELLVAQQP